MQKTKKTKSFPGRRYKPQLLISSKPLKLPVLVVSVEFSKLYFSLLTGIADAVDAVFDRRSQLNKSEMQAVIESHVMTAIVRRSTEETKNVKG